MFQGTVWFVATIKTGNGLKFEQVVFDPRKPGVAKVVLSGPDGKDIQSTVHLSSVPSKDEGREAAHRVNTSTLNQIAFLHDIAIEDSRITSEQFSPLDPRPGVAYGGVAIAHAEASRGRVVIGLAPDLLKAELEQAVLPDETRCGPYRSALLSTSTAERYMHLYHLLLMHCNDLQRNVDAFIISEEPNVPQSQVPDKKLGMMETVYTRLRNELGHPRRDVDLANTKEEMETWLFRLMTLTKRAIERHP